MKFLNLCASFNLPSGLVVASDSTFALTFYSSKLATKPVTEPPSFISILKTKYHEKKPVHSKGDLYFESKGFRDPLIFTFLRIDRGKIQSILR